ERRSPSSMIASVSTNGQPSRAARRRPTSVFPVAMNPVSTTRATSEAPHVLEVAVVVASDLRQRIAAELLEERVGDHERDDGLPDHGGGGDRDHVRALDRGLGLV